MTAAFVLCIALIFGSLLRVPSFTLPSLSHLPRGSPLFANESFRHVPPFHFSIGHAHGKTQLLALAEKSSDELEVSNESLRILLGRWETDEGAYNQTISLYAQMRKRQIPREVETCERLLLALSKRRPPLSAGARDVAFSIAWALYLDIKKLGGKPSEDVILAVASAACRSFRSTATESLQRLLEDIEAADGEPSDRVRSLYAYTISHTARCEPEGWSKAVRLFEKMEKKKIPRDAGAYAAVFWALTKAPAKACGSMAWGMFQKMREEGVRMNSGMTAGLLRCLLGSDDDARWDKMQEVFELMRSLSLPRTTAHYRSLFAGARFAEGQPDSTAAISVFEDMRLQKVQPDDETAAQFLWSLSGLPPGTVMESSLAYFRLMKASFNLVPRESHLAALMHAAACGWPGEETPTVLDLFDEKNRLGLRGSPEFYRDALKVLKPLAQWGMGGSQALWIFGLMMKEKWGDGDFSVLVEILDTIETLLEKHTGTLDPELLVEYTEVRVYLRMGGVESLFRSLQHGWKREWKSAMWVYESVGAEGMTPSAWEALMWTLLKAGRGPEERATSDQASRVEAMLKVYEGMGKVGAEKSAQLYGHVLEAIRSQAFSLWLDATVMWQRRGYKMSSVEEKQEHGLTFWRHALKVWDDIRRDGKEDGRLYAIMVSCVGVVGQFDLASRFFKEACKRGYLETDGPELFSSFLLACSMRRSGGAALDEALWALGSMREKGIEPDAKQVKAVLKCLADSSDPSRGDLGAELYRFFQRGGLKACPEQMERRELKEYMHAYFGVLKSAARAPEGPHAGTDIALDVFEEMKQFKENVRPDLLTRLSEIFGGARERQMEKGEGGGRIPTTEDLFDFAEERNMKLKADWLQEWLKSTEDWSEQTDLADRYFRNTGLGLDAKWSLEDENVPDGLRLDSHSWELFLIRRVSERERKKKRVVSGVDKPQKGRGRINEILDVAFGPATYEENEVWHDEHMA